MQPCPQPVRLLLPLRLAAKLGGEVRLPKRDVANAANPKHRYQLRALLLQRGDLFGITGQLRLDGEMPLARRHRVLAERTIESLLHRVLKGARRRRRQRIALGVGHSSMLKPWTCSHETPHSLRK